jgi:dGTP triphosphohydrolase
MEDGKELVNATTLNIWSKMIAKYFRAGGREISFESIKRYFPAGMEKTLKIRDKQLVVIKTQLAAAEKKIDNTEMNLVEENINGKTYKKLMHKLSAEKARLEDELKYLEEDMEDQIRQDLLVLPYMMNLPAIFKDASLNQQHAIIHEVFKEVLTYQGGVRLQHPRSIRGLLITY